MKKKIVLAYSGGLDTTVIIPWLKENYDCAIVAVCVDVGQEADWDRITQRALDTGALSCFVADVKQEYVENYVWPALKANACYEDKYLLGTSTARPLIAKVLVDYARKEGAMAIAHGATGKGNDQVRFDLGIMAFFDESTRKGSRPLPGDVGAPGPLFDGPGGPKANRFYKRRTGKVNRGAGGG